MKTTKLVLITLLLAFIYSCKKTKLKGDLSFLIGEWEWVRTENVTGENCEHVSIQTPQTEGYTYRLKFEEKGILRIYKNGKQTEKYRLVENFHHTMQEGVKYEYDFKFNNRKKKDFFVRIYLAGSDTLYNIPNLPISAPNENNCFDAENVYTRAK